MTDDRLYVRVTKWGEEWIDLDSFPPEEKNWRNGQLAHLGREDRWIPFQEAVKRLVVLHD